MADELYFPETGLFDIGHFKIGHFQFIPMERTKKTLNDPKIKRENPEARVTVNGFKHHAQVKVILEFKVTSKLMLVWPEITLERRNWCIQVESMHVSWLT